MRAQAMSELFLKFWVEQSELMVQTEKNGGTIVRKHFLKQPAECLLNSNNRLLRKVEKTNWILP